MAGCTSGHPAELSLMPGRQTSLFSLLLLLALALPMPAQRFVELPDGRIVEGETRRGREATTVRTALGTFTVAGKVKAADTKAAQALVRDYEAQVAELPHGKFLPGRLAIARWAEQAGLFSGVRDQLDAILRVDSDHAGARAMVRSLAQRFRVDEREGGTRGRDQRGLVRQLCERHAGRGVYEALVVREKLRAAPRDLVFRAAMKARKAREPSTRYLAMQLLAEHRKETTRIRPLLDRALTDRVFAVRREATRALKVTEDPVFVRLIARNLGHEEAAVRRNAAEALAELGMPQAIRPLIAAVENGGRPVRANIAVTTQRAYVKDYDVEVAQGAIIADPIVDVVQDGTSLDVGIVGVSIVRATAAAALARITGESFGTDVAAWKRYEQNRQKQAAEQSRQR